MFTKRHEHDIVDEAPARHVDEHGARHGLGVWLIAGSALLLVSLIAALAGGKVGRNYHSKVDAAHLT